MTFDEIVDRLAAKRNGPRRAMARCPAHDDKTPSLSIGEGDDGKVLLTCHAGCSFDEIRDALGIDAGDFSGRENGKKSSDSPARIVKIYEYRNAEGRLLYENCRYQNKTFRQRRPDGAGGFVWNLQGVERVPYRLQALAAAGADQGRRIFLAEGEKDADALARLGFIATNSKNWQTGFNQHIAGAAVVIFCDHDATGRKIADDAARTIRPAAASVRIVDPFAGEPERGQDVSDFIVARRSAGDDDEEIVRRLLALADGEECSSWDPPRPLDTVLRPVEAFDPDSVPGALIRWLAPAARVIGCPIDFLILAVVLNAGIVIGSRLRLRPVRSSDWFVVGNLYAGLVGLPSSKKTPALDEARRPILALKREAKEKFDREAADFEIKSKFYERESARILKESKSERDYTDRIQALNKPRKPIFRRFETNDVTASKLVQLLHESPAGLLLFRDELAGWLRSLEADYDKSARALYLELWPGAAAYELARVDGRDLFLTSGTLSILGGIQPSKLQRYVAEAYSFDNSDGLLQRFLFVYPDAVARQKAKAEDAAMLRAGFEATLRLFRELAEAEFGSKTVTGSGDRFAAVEFDAEAQRLADEWRDEIEEEAESFQTSDEAWAAYLYKLPKSAFAIALIFHAVEHGDRADQAAVSEQTLARALLYSDYLKSHAARVFALGENQIFALAAALVGKIERGELRSGFTRAQVARKQWAGLRDRETVGDVLALLVEYNYLREIRTAGPGRPTVEFEINPAIGEAAK